MKHRLPITFAAALMLAATPGASRQPLRSASEHGAEQTGAVQSVMVESHWLQRAVAQGEAVPADVRSRGAFTAGHLPEAVHLDLPPAGEREEALTRALGAVGLSGAETVVVYGDGGGYEEEARAFLLLERAGCSEVRVLQGGLAAWRRAGGPVEQGEAGKTAVPFTASSQRPVFASAGWLSEVLGRPGVEILDLRDQGWEGNDYGAPPTFRRGHIPHSLPYDFSRTLPADGSWSTEDERRRLGELGPRRRDYVDLSATFVLYGADAQDPEPALGYLVLRSLGIQARVLEGGWAAWTRGGERPVVRILSAPQLAAVLRIHDPAGEPPRRRAIILDLREDWDYEDGHLPGAISLPSRLFADSFEALVTERWPDADRAHIPVVFYCYGRPCVRSRNCATQAAHMGFQNLVWFREGLPAWEKAGLPVERAAQ